MTRPAARSRPAARWRRTRPTRLAWRTAMLCVGIASAAINTGNTLLYLLLSLTIATLPVSWLFARQSLRRLDVEPSTTPVPTARAPYLLELTLRQRGGRLAARAVRVLVGGAGAVAETTIERIDPAAELRVALARRAPEAGLHRVGTVRLRTSFPFGLLLVEREIAVDIRLLTLPAADGELPDSDNRGTREGGRRVDDPGGIEFDGLRPGSEFDDPRRIDWKATARRGTTVLREGAGAAQPRLELQLSSVRPTSERSVKAFERELIDVAARGRAMLAAGGEVQLRLDGATPALYAGAGDIGPLLSRLGALTPHASDGRPLPLRRLPVVTTAPGAARPAPEPERALRRSARVALGIGCVGLTIFDGINPFVGAVLVLALIVTHLRPSLVASPTGPMGRLWRVAGVTALIGFVIDLVAIRHNPLASSIDLVVFISIFAVFSARRPRDDGQILLISFLHLILSAALTTEIVFGLMLVAWVAVTTHGAVASSVLGRTRDSPGTIRLAPPPRRGPRYWRPALASAAMVVVFAGPIYLALPHLGTGAFRGGGLVQQRASGFGDETRLGDIGRIKLDDSRVMEIEVEGPATPGELRWRGLVLDRFDGRGWTRAQNAAQTYVARDGEIRMVGEFGDGRAPLIQRVRLEPGRSSALFAAPGVASIRSGDIRFLRRHSSGTLELPSAPNRRLRYEVESYPARRDAVRLRASGDGDTNERQRWLALPELDPRVAELAETITRDLDTRYDRAEAIERWLSSSIEYSLNVDDIGRGDPLSAFLFDGMAGHCEYFATAMVVLARSAGIPSRFAAGYLRGSENRLIGRFVVRQSDAHAWAELYFPGTGWVTFDATPAEGRPTWSEVGLGALASSLRSTLTRWWDDVVVGLDLDDQLRIWLSIADGVSRHGRLLATILVLAAGLGFGLRVARRHRSLTPVRDRGGPAARRSGRPTIPRYYRKMLVRLARFDLTPSAAETAQELARRARAVLPPDAALTVDELTRLYERQRFSGDARDGDLSRSARVLLDRLRRELNVAKRRAA